MTPPTTEQTKAYHTRWQQLSGLDLPYDLSRHFAWERWIAKGITISDLETIVGYIRKRIKAGRREKESLMFRNLVGNVDNALEDLSIARAEARNTPISTPRTRVLAQAGLTEYKPTKARPVKDILASDLAFKNWREAMAKEGLL